MDSLKLTFSAVKWLADLKENSERDVRELQEKFPNKRALAVFDLAESHLMMEHGLIRHGHDKISKRTEDKADGIVDFIFSEADFDLAQIEDSESVGVDLGEDFIQAISITKRMLTVKDSGSAKD